MSAIFTNLKHRILPGLCAVEEAERQLVAKAEAQGHKLETEFLTGYDGVIGTCKHCDKEADAYIRSRNPLTIEFWGNAIAGACVVAAEKLL
jgi:hypothetical protein